MEVNGYRCKINVKGFKNEGERHMQSWPRDDTTGGRSWRALPLVELVAFASTVNMMWSDTEKEEAVSQTLAARGN